jgi:hypothetical protein
MRGDPYSWQRKVSQNLLELAGIYKEYVHQSVRMNNMTPVEREEILGPEPDKKTKNRARDKMLQLVSEQDPDHAKASEPFYAASLSAAEGRPIPFKDYAVVYDAVPGEPPGNRWLLGMMEFIAEQRYGRPLYQILEEDRAGVQESSKKILRIVQDASQLRYAEPVITPKGKIDHRVMFDFGLGRGLEELTAEELLGFFDEFCPFCERLHDPESLRRQRDSFLQQRKEANNWSPNKINPTKKSPK